MFTEADIRFNLLQFYGAESGATIENVRQLPGGWEAHLFAYTVTYPDERPNLELVIRLFDSDDGADKARREFIVMRHLSTTGYPVPGVYQQQASADNLFQSPFVIMDFVPGTVLGPTMLETQPFQQQDWLEVLVQLLVDLHQTPWPERLDLPFDPGDSLGFIQQLLASYQDGVARLVPDMLPLLEGLLARQRSVPCPAYSLLHNDFHPWNVLQRPDDSLVVIDWAGAIVGDPRFDVAWSWLLLTTQLGANAANRFVALYETQAGVELQGFDFFQELALERRLASILIAAEGGATQIGMRDEAVQAMQRQAGQTREVYRLFQEMTGQSLPRLENLLASWEA